MSDTSASCIEQLQAVAVSSTDITDLMKAISPLVRVLRYGTARRLPEDALRALILSISVEINAGVRIGSRRLDEDIAAARISAVEAYDEALRLLGDDALTSSWRTELGKIVSDDQVTPSIAGLSLRRLHDVHAWRKKELRPSLLGTQAHGSQKNRELSSKVSCAADQKSFCRTNRCCSCSTHGSASLMRGTSLIHFLYCAEACRASMHLRVVGCLRKFSSDINKA